MPTANQPPVITLPSSAPSLYATGVSYALHAITISDADALSSNQKITVSLTAANGALSLPDIPRYGTISGSGSSTLTLAGSLSDVDADLANLSFSTFQSGSNTIQIRANDGVSTTTGSLSVTGITPTPLVITGPSSVTTPTGTWITVNGLSIVDPNPADATDTYKILVSANAGIVQTSNSASSGSLLITGTLASVNAKLASLTFEDSTVGNTSLDILAILTENSATFALGSLSIPVTVKPPAAPDQAPTVSAPRSQITIAAGTTNAVSGIVIADPDALAQNQTMAVTLTTQHSALSIAGGAGTISGNGSNTLTLSGSLTQVNADLAALSVFDPRTQDFDRVDVTVNDGFQSAQGSLSFVTTHNGTTNIVAPTSLAAKSGAAIVVSGISLDSSIIGTDLISDTFAVTIQASAGTLSTAVPWDSHFTQRGSTIAFSGDSSSVGWALSSLTFSDPTPGTGTITVTMSEFEQGLQVGQASKTIAVTISPPPPPPPPHMPLVTITHPITPAMASGSIAPAEAALIDTQSYLANNADVRQAGLDAAAHFVEFGWKEKRAPDPLFDVTYYLQHSPDVARAGMDPLLHYAEYGWKEGRDPSASFSTKAYLAANPDVKLAGIDPLEHYLLFGVAEGRAVSAPQ